MAVTEGPSPLRYVSTRGGAPAADFEEAALAGLAPDGGLYLPERWPADPEGFRGLRDASYADTAARVVLPFAAGAVEPARLAALCREAYAGFDSPEVVPLRPLGDGLHLLELFHGPTLAFKDLALQLLGRLFDLFLERRGRRALVLCATSGDTGAAAIEACRGSPSMTVVVLHPEGRIAPLQRRMMTTVDDASVHNVAVAGTFDDCQRLVKDAFSDPELREACGLAAVNSINWIRIAAQAAYYVHAGLRADPEGRGAVFAVPSGNFGDCYAGHVAASMGLPVRRLVVATNRNDILARFFADGGYRPGTVHGTLSPAMDIQVASNFERLLFEIRGRDGGAVGRDMRALAADGGFAVGADAAPELRARFAGVRIDEEETLAEMRRVHERSGVFVDPHTAVGLAAARRAGTAGDAPTVALATAHPAKFGDAVRRATGEDPPMPERLARCLDAPERLHRLPPDPGPLKAFLREAAGGAPRV